MNKTTFENFHQNYARYCPVLVSLLDDAMDDHAVRVCVLVPAPAWDNSTGADYCKTLKDWPQLAGARVICITEQSGENRMVYGPTAQVSAELPLADLETLAAAVESGALVGKVWR